MVLTLACCLYRLLQTPLYSGTSQLVHLSTWARSIPLAHFLSYFSNSLILMSFNFIKESIFPQIYKNNKLSREYFKITKTSVKNILSLDSLKPFKGASLHMPRESHASKMKLLVVFANCYGLNVYAPLNSYFEILTPKVTALRDEDFMRWLGMRVEPHEWN